MTAEASPRVFATPAGIVLGPLDMVRDGAARNFVIQMKAGRFHGFVVRRGATAVGYVDRCPHAGLPLARQIDDYLSPDGRHIVCAWHGALFEPADGRCVGGPCVDAHLMPWPVDVVAGILRTA